MFVSRRLPLLCLSYVFVSKIASFHSRLPFRHQWVGFQTHFLSENCVRTIGESEKPLVSYNTI